MMPYAHTTKYTDDSVQKITRACYLLKSKYILWLYLFLYYINLVKIVNTIFNIFCKLFCRIFATVKLLCRISNNVKLLCTIAIDDLIAQADTSKALRRLCHKLSFAPPLRDKDICNDLSQTIRKEENMQKSEKNSERLDLTIGIAVMVVLLIVTVMGAWWVFRAIKNADYSAMGGELSCEEAVRGKETTFTFVPNGKLSEGDTVIWSVNGNEVQRSEYGEGEEICLRYAPPTSGTMELSVSAGRYAQTRVVDVARPVLTLTAPQAEMIYGEEMPQLGYSASGFVGDEEKDFCFDGMCVADIDGAGVYSVTFDKQCDYLDYDVRQTEGILTVLPRKLNVTGNLTKIYDGTNTILNPSLQLEGALDGDDVCLCCDELYFDNKNVGSDKTILLATARLEGDDARNYLLPDFVSGEIVPKQIFLNGLTVQDKLFDGTTKATVDKTGQLDGVVSGDSVAVGGISVNFEDASVGQHGVEATVRLVGADKDNYTVCVPDGLQAEIGETATFWDKLLNKEKLAQTE